MSDCIIVEGAKPYDGRYELDIGELTAREWGWIKRLAGYLPSGLDEDAMSDPELTCVLAVIMMRRAGRITTQELPQVYDRLIDAPVATSVRIEVDETDEGEVDDRPPASNSNGSSSDSGLSSSESSATLAPLIPRGSGMHDSATSPSAPATSVS